MSIFSVKSSNFIFLVLLLIHLSNWTRAQVYNTLNVNLINGTLNVPRNFEVVNYNQTVIQYLLTSDFVDFKKGELRMEVEITDKNFNSQECPLLLTLSQGKHVSSWDLPRTMLTENFDLVHLYHWAKTVCIDPDINSIGIRRTIQIAAVISTCNIKPVPFKIVLKYQPTALSIPIGQVQEISVAPTTPRFYSFYFTEDEDIQTVLIKLKSETEICMTLSVQSPSCPVLDEETNVRHAGYWQTFTSIAGITVERKDFKNGFFLVLVTNYHDKGCTNKDGYQPSDNIRTLSSSTKDNSIELLMREKSVKFSIEKVLHQNQYAWPTIFPLLIYFFVLVITFVLFTFFHRASVDVYGEMNVKPEVKCPLRSEKYICDSYDQLDTMKRQKIENKSKRYLWLLVTVAIFYSIPVFQLIINYLGIVYRTGEQDICYYNNLCSLPLNKIMDFNHIYSNVGYCVFGVAFIFFAFLRQRSMEGRRGIFVYNTSPVCGILPRLPKKIEYGTFDQFGLFYSLGFALIMEGFLSASYHICPNKANFQFDTSFMYAMAVLSYVKVYQFRHTLYMSELMSFQLLALVTACVVFGLFSTNKVFSILLSLVHLLLVLAFQFYLLYISSIPRDGTTIFDRMWGISLELVGIERNSKFLIKYHPNKSLFWWTVWWNILLVINSWTLVYGSNFATQVLYILLANLALYVIYYFLMKIIHGEFRGLFTSGPTNPTLQAVIYGIFACIFMLPGMYFFVNPQSGWDLSPSESRAKNKDCIMLQFYDNHDLWHLLSAPGLFFSFMVFLTVDDGLIGRHQESIPVF